MLTIKQTMIDQFMSMRIHNKKSHHPHPSYLLEQQLLEAITRKDMDRASLLLNHINQISRVPYARRKLRTLKNSMISLCTLFTRSAIKGGVNPETAFQLNERYLQKIEDLTTAQAIRQLEHTMLEEFIQAVEKSDELPYSPVINKAITYLHEHILSDLTLEDIAQACYVSPSYLSHLFKKEVGLSIIQFINEKRVEESKYFLLHTSTSIADIARLFQFCNQSYYTSVFKKYVQQTPKQYREAIGAPPLKEC
ncbi:AraC family transcriptional regulator [Thalassobacillus devorans]|uniref:AraC family transcriptional regulator n=1 Tax=Thalassobacillus devorans TaxID=279813 RepID=UPI00048D8C07|nr:AraC family transcriptional regulator [Thalassobacillus devorans]